jgi:putative nucleotidyltransferase with HDIG domain
VAHRQPEDALTRRRTPFGVLDALVRAVDRKDRYTRQHSQQNAEYAVELGKAIGLSEGTLNALRIAGLLHDVGKIGVPDDILRKPGALSEDEKAIMREHVTLSNLIVHGVPNLQDVSAAVYSHHERLTARATRWTQRGDSLAAGSRSGDAYSDVMTAHKAGTDSPGSSARVASPFRYAVRPQPVEPFIRSESNARVPRRRTLSRPSQTHLRPSRRTAICLLRSRGIGIFV